MKNNKKEQGRHEHPLSHEIKPAEKEQASHAHSEADRDMKQDAELTSQSPNDDLDEGESARLGEGKNHLI